MERSNRFQNTDDLTFAIEGILFAAGEPVPKARLASILGVDDGAINYALEQLEMHYNDQNRGIRLLFMQDSAQLCSAPEYADVIREVLEKRKVNQLSPSGLEVLSIVAYFQPVTRAYIEKVRGVESKYTIQTLEARGLIESCGQLQVPGRPTLFQTTKAFLRVFGLTDLSELPPLPEAEEESEAQAALLKSIEALQNPPEEEAPLFDLSETEGDVQDGIGQAEENMEPDAEKEVDIENPNEQAAGGM